MRITYCDRCGKETESPIRTLCKKCWTELEEELHYPKTPYITNADRIRSMTDEELANCITDDLCDRVCHSPLSCDGNCEIQVLEWLKQEYTP